MHFRRVFSVRAPTHHTHTQPIRAPTTGIPSKVSKTCLNTNRHQQPRPVGLQLPSCCAEGISSNPTIISSQKKC